MHIKLKQNYKVPYHRTDTQLSKQFMASTNELNIQKIIYSKYDCETSLQKNKKNTPAITKKIPQNPSKDKKHLAKHAYRLLLFRKENIMS